jgi:hypothetical protein
LKNGIFRPESPGGIAIFLTKKETLMTTDPPVNSPVQMMLSDADHDRLTTLIYAILDAVSAWQVSRMEAMLPSLTSSQRRRSAMSVSYAVGSNRRP